MPNYKKRSTYQTGGAAKPQPPKIPAGFRLPPRNVPQRPTSQDQYLAQRQRELQAQRDRMSEAARRDAAMMKVGNRQRAAAMDAARKRAYNQATATTQRQAQSMRQREQQLAAMRQQRAPARAQDLRNTPRKLSPAQQRLMDSYNRGMAQRQQPRPQMRTPTPQELARLRANPNRPSMSNQVQTLNQGNALERQRIQQQIAQLQARLRQLGG